MENAQEYSTEKEMLERYGPFQMVNIKPGPTLSYLIGDPIKNSMILNEGNHLTQHQNFSQIAQMLWSFRDHPEYFSYQNTNSQRLLDALGHESVWPENPDKLGEYALAQLDPRTDFDAHRELTSAWIRKKKKFWSEETAVFVPSLDSMVRPGIITDLVYVFGRRSKMLPPISEQKYWENSIRNNNANSLFLAGVVLPYISPEDLGLDNMFFAPSNCTRKNMQDYVRKSIGKRPQEEVDQRVEEELNKMKRLGMIPLKDSIESSIELIKEFASEKLERFQQAVVS